MAPQLTLSDVDSPTLAGATVTLTDPQTGDVLSLQGQAGTQRHAGKRDHVLDFRRERDLRQCLVTGGLSGRPAAGPV